MTPDPSPFLKKIRRLSQTLMISGALNIGVLGLLSYWMMRERPPTPYCELKPASDGQQQIPLADHRGCAEVVAQLYKQPFYQLVSCLNHTKLVENGYAERDLALSCLIAFHHFDVQRALPADHQPQQKRLLAWRHIHTGESIVLPVYPSLSEQQFESIIHFAKTERWPMTAQGLFSLLQNQSDQAHVDLNLIDTFMLTPEFWTVELLFSRCEQAVCKQKILEILRGGTWDLLKQFVDQQRQLHDLSDARRQKFLLDYIKAGVRPAAELLLQLEWDFAVKKLDDAQVVAILQLLLTKTAESERFAKEMLTSPRSTSVWYQASSRLYEYAGEVLPKDWNYQATLARFASEKLLEAKLPAASTSLPVIPSKNLALAPPAATTASKEVKPNPLPSVGSKPLDKASSASTAINKKAKQKLLPAETPKPLATVSSAPTAVNKEIRPMAQSKSVAMTENSTPGFPSNKSTKSTFSAKKAALSSPQPLASVERVYIVQEGDSLWKISRRFGVEVEALKDFNQLQSNAIKPGSLLKIP